MKHLSIILLLLSSSMPLYQVTWAQTSFGIENSELMPSPEPLQPNRLADLVREEQFDYPVLRKTTTYPDRNACLKKLSSEFRAWLKQKVKVTRREPHWLEVYVNEGRNILLCDYNYSTQTWDLKIYWDSNNNIPPRWFMLRNSLDFILREE